MKKLIFVISIICAFTLCLTACDEKEEKTNTENQANTTQTQKVSANEKEEIIEVATTSGENMIVEEKKEEPKKEEENSEYTTIKFSDMYETKGSIKNVSTMLKNLNGKKVRIKGYPAVQSPLDESFVYLNNQPYVTCPFCTIGDVTKLEVIPIYMANKGKIKYTENAIDVVGTLEVSPKVDTEGYTTQFRVYADKVSEIQDSTANKLVNEYYSKLSERGMIYDIQTLQMNIEYATNPQYMMYYDSKLQTGASTTLDKVAVCKAIAEEYIGYDSEYGDGFGTDYTYLEYVKECPGIVESCAPEDERLKGLNDELVKLYNDQISILEKFQNICYKIYASKDNVTEKDANKYFSDLQALNKPNMKQYEIFTAWNNKLRD